MTHTAPDRNKHYTEADFHLYIKQQSNWDRRTLLLLPNLEPLAFDKALDRLGYHAYPERNYLHGYILAPGTSEPYWGTAFMHTLQGGGWDGAGFVVVAGWGGAQHPTFAGTFALCKHKNIYLPSAKPHRGFHDQFCELCGLDTSVDSSD